MTELLGSPPSGNAGMVIEGIIYSMLFAIQYQIRRLSEPRQNIYLPYLNRDAIFTLQT